MDFPDGAYLIGPCSQLRRQSNHISLIQGMDLTEIICCAPVMSGQTDIAVPDAGT